MKLVLDANNQLGECILWCERSQALFWTDIPGCSLYRLSYPQLDLSHWDMPERLACFALTGDSDSLLLGLATQLAFFSLSTQSLTHIAPVETDLPTTRINDGRCDRQGRFVFGTLNEDPERAAIGHFYRLNRDLSLEQLPIAPVAIANSICFSPDGKLMYYCDSLAKAIYCCDYDDHASSSASTSRFQPRLFADLQEEPGVPDGSIIDAEGYLWNAQWGGGSVTRYTPSGLVDQRICLPVTQTTCLAFGGAAFSTLFVTSATDELTPIQVQQQALAGSIFQQEFSTIRGLPESRFSK